MFLGPRALSVESGGGLLCHGPGGCLAAYPSPFMDEVYEGVEDALYALGACYGAL